MNQHRFSARRQIWPTLTGVVAGCLVTGLLLPFVVGSRVGPPASVESSALELAEPGAGATTPPPDAIDGNSAPVSPGTEAGAATAPDARGRPGVQPAVPVESLTASDVGVTPTSIKVGVFLLDLGTAGRFGLSVPGYDVATQRAMWQGYFDDANERGGVLGRRIDVLYEPVDVTSQDAMRAACLHFTEDEKAFATLTDRALFGPAILCITAEHQTPHLAADGVLDEFYGPSRGLLLTTAMGKTRINRNLAWALDRLGALKGHKIGILTSQTGDDDKAVTKGLVPALEEMGYTVTHLSNVTADAGTGQGQMSVEVQQMRTKGVDFVMLATNVVYTAVFVREDEAQRWYPHYYVSDFASGATDFFAKTMSDDFQAHGITSMRTGEWRRNETEPPDDAAYRQRHKAKTGTDRPRSDDNYGAMQNVYTVVSLFSRGAAGAGPKLTRQVWSQSMRRLTSFPVGFTAGGGFGPAKFDAPDLVRTVRFEKSCKCWLPIDGFVRVRY